MTIEEQIAYVRKIMNEELSTPVCPYDFEVIRIVLKISE